eukprot:5600151-Alexandrium_andersonii.AAC.1
MRAELLQNKDYQTLGPLCDALHKMLACIRSVNRDGNGAIVDASAYQDMVAVCQHGKVTVAL